MYVQFREEEHAANALQNLSGRFYAGTHVSVMTIIIICFKFLLDHGD